MSYDINYSKLSQEEGDKKAMADALFFNKRGVEALEQEVAKARVAETPINYELLKLLFAFIGIQGRPVLAFARKWNVELPEDLK